MQLEALCVIHHQKDLGRDLSKPLNPPPTFPGGVFHLETCQRQVWALTADQFDSLGLERKAGFSLYRGRDAYSFLIRLASGLESEILGETDVFGQIKEAWKKTKERLDSGELAGGEFQSLRDLVPWMQRIFEDTKEIRTEYLQNLGGSSYGTLVRRLLRDSATKSGRSEAPILLVGAGQIAQSVAPFLLDSELWLWNRSSERLQDLYQSLSGRPRARVRKIEADSLSKEVWHQAGSIVICIPVSSDWNAERIRQLSELDTNKLVVHLGGTRKECGDWMHLPQFHSLSELFSLQNSLGSVRSMQVANAKAACEQRSTLRALGTSLSISHGWEDLACFN